MLLLDQVAQCTAPFILVRGGGARWRLTGVSDFAGPLRQCPLRYVLSDELVRTCIALAYSDGDELCGCLDLLHLPAQHLWIEWDEAARRAELQRCLSRHDLEPAPDVLRAGVLVSADPSCRSGSLHTFWLNSAEPHEPVLAAVETLLDLDGAVPAAAAAELLQGRCVGVSDPQNGPLDGLLRCARFRLDRAWQGYYREVAATPALRRQVIERSLAAVAFDVPLLLALFLLLSIRGDLVRQTVDLRRLNCKRLRLGKRPLLEHLKISAPVFTPAAATRAAYEEPERRGPRAFITCAVISSDATIRSTGAAPLARSPATRQRAHAYRRTGPAGLTTQAGTAPGDRDSGG